MCGPFAWGFWWILPLIGMVVCLGMLLASRHGMGGPGCMWMIGRGGTPEDEAGRTGGRGKVH